MKCKKCASYVEDKQQCHRFPTIVEKTPHDWCLEFKEREVIVCPVEEKVEKAKVEEVRVEEKAESEPFFKQRGWPRGRPRKSLV